MKIEIRKRGGRERKRERKQNILNDARAGGVQQIHSAQRAENIGQYLTTSKKKGAIVHRHKKIQHARAPIGMKIMTRMRTIKQARNGKRKYLDVERINSEKIILDIGKANNLKEG